MFGGQNKGDYQDAEGHDRKEYGLPYGQDRLIEALAKANKRFVYVNISGNPVEMPWKDKVPAIVQGWFLGSTAGEALADVLTGRVNPSGKLPYSWMAKLDDYGAHKLGTYPGKWRSGKKIIDEEYKEGLFVGYRWVDKEPLGRQGEAAAPVRLRPRPQLHHLQARKGHGRQGFAGRRRQHFVHAERHQHRQAGRRRGSAAVRPRLRVVARAPLQGA